ncbi:MAG: flagellar basal body L-ring protein FlgH [Thermodesulfobacteriaceae bacterium]|nr:flagellar basal body L-ring protein FlgH [Thermodesulfobacteriaceae bacterium]MCX8041285.1 flagellar basal body L-ring protein FlgH [Thermodesulfobacteriaceae bacterium]MDW8135444.1 flagellar basal body L-ring protein FlgH [Thermodesulfobacterium sp.]
MKRKIRIFLIAGLVSFLIGGCFEYDPKVPPPPPPPPKVEVPPKKPQLFFSYADFRAKEVGDLITIKIVETYQSSNTVKQQSAKTSSSSAGVSAFLGFENKIGEIFPNANPSNLFKGDLSTSTSGQGQISRESRIVATLSARVVEVLPNGYLVIQGSRAIKRNKDLEYITLTGIVRPQDIAPDNSILSTQISDAYLEYSGKGPSSEAVSGPGVFTRLLQIFWPF